MNLKVFKFGGASVKEAKGIKNVCEIIKDHADSPLLVVISAMGKTTNALEKVVEAYVNESDQANSLLEEIKKQHFNIVGELFPERHEVFAHINDLFVEIDWILEDPVNDGYDYLYDQIVSVAELVSTRIVAAYLNLEEPSTSWMDARDVILTDDTFRDARIKWDQTIERIQKTVIPLLEKNKVVLTQGFIGSTSENLNTTLGREGSDFSAAIFAYCLDAESMSIWKDVPGILTADPRIFDDATLIDRMSYTEAIEMTYYGAKVIHPKTIKPLQNKNIPMYVKSFKKPEAPGTLISGEDEAIKYPPVIVVEKEQSLLHIATKDFSFVAESHLSDIFKLFAHYRIKVNMMQNMAVSFSVCVTNNPRRLEQFLDVLQKDFKVVKKDNLKLLTVRHFHEDILKKLTQGKIILLEERIRNTVQMVIKTDPSTLTNDE